MVTNADLLGIRAGKEVCMWQARLSWAWPVTQGVQTCLRWGLSGNHCSCYGVTATVAAQCLCFLLARDYVNGFLRRFKMDDGCFLHTFLNLPKHCKQCKR